VWSGAKKKEGGDGLTHDLRGFNIYKDRRLRRATGAAWVLLFEKRIYTYTG
jgi:hypothetical protein